MTKWKHGNRRTDHNGWPYNSGNSSNSKRERCEPQSYVKILKREAWSEGSNMDQSVWSRGLPEDVYCTILAHLPLSSFYRLRTVCKCWNLMGSDKNFVEACSRVRSRASCFLLMGGDHCWMYEPAMNKWKSIPPSFLLPHDSDTPTHLVSSAGGRLLLLRKWRLLLHNPLNNSLKLLPPMLDMDRTDLPTLFDIHITGMYVNYDEGDAISILVMNQTSNVDEEVDDNFDFYDPIVSQVYDSRADSWTMLTDFDPLFKLSILSASMVDSKLRFLISSHNLHPRASDLAMYSVLPNKWEKENIRMPSDVQPLVAPHLFTYEGGLMMVAALPTIKTRNDMFPTWNNVIVWALSSEQSDCHWTRVFEIGSEELNADIWNTPLESFFFMSGGSVIYFGSRNGSSLGMINLKSQTWRLLPTFPGITFHFSGSIANFTLQTFLFDPRFDLVV